MKKLLITALIFVLASLTIIAQDKAAGELIIWINNNPGAEIKIEVQLVSTLCWDAIDELGYYDVHDLTTEYPGSYQITFTDAHLDWEACWAQSTTYMFGLGNYKVTAYQKISGEFEERDYFYIDYRTSDLPENFGSGDVTVDFNFSNGNFYYRSTQNLFPTTTSIWAQKPWIDSVTTELEPLPPDNFNLTSSGAHPYISWNHSSNTGDYWTGYAVYRSVVSGCGSTAGTFGKIATVSKQITNYTDFTLAVSGPMTAYYKIAALNGNRGSEYTESLNICVGLNKGSTNETIYDYILRQNYPNPFNPTTQISFSLKENSFVSLKVYDILGREVAVLVNEVLTAGNHQVQFNGSSLKSGIYFYEIRTDKFRDMRKLVLLK